MCSPKVKVLCQSTLCHELNYSGRRCYSSAFRSQ